MDLNFSDTDCFISDQISAAGLLKILSLSDQYYYFSPLRNDGFFYMDDIAKTDNK